MSNKGSFQSDFSSLERIVNKLLDSRHSTHGLYRALRKVSKEIVLYKSHGRGMERWRNEKLSAVKVQIGGGKHVIDGYLNIDITPPADLICDVREGLPLNNDCCEHIFSEHFLEHLDYPVSVKRFIRECYRILKSGGEIIIGVPDSGLAVENYYKKDQQFYKKAFEIWYSKRNFSSHLNTYIDLLNYHFRDQDDDEKYNPHLWAYDHEKLDSLLRECGFLTVEHWDFDKSIANPKRKYGSIYVIAIK